MHRAEQLAHELRDLVAVYLKEQVEFPTGALVTVTRAHVPAGKGTATVYLSVLPPELGPAVLASVRPHLYDLQGHANHSLRRHHPPRLTLALEDHLAAAGSRP